MAVKKNERGVTYAKGRISRGKVDYDSKWEWKTEDEDKILGDPPNWKEYGNWFLATDDESKEESKGHWKFPYGKGGKVYKSALVAAKQRASQAGYDSVKAAASALLDIVNNKAESARRFTMLGPKDAPIGVMLSDAIYMVEDGGPEGWVQICRSGSWKAHPQVGAFDVTDDDLAVMKVNFERYVNPVMVDRGHESVWNMGAIAYGWCHEMELQENGSRLYGRIEWTKTAAEMIRAGELKYISPVILFHALDPETGEDIGYSIFTLALTSNPFMDGMDPIEIGQQLAAASKRLMAGKTTTASAVDNSNPPPLPAEPDHGASEDDMEKKVICAALGIPETSTDVEVATAIQAAKQNAGTAAEAVRVAGELRAENAKLATEAQAQKDRVLALEKANEERVSAECAALVESYIKAGRLAPASREQAVALAKSDRATFETLYGKVNEPRPAVVPMAGTPAPAPQGGTPGVATLTEEERALCAKSGLDPEKFAAERDRRAAKGILGVHRSVPFSATDWIE